MKTIVLLQLFRLLSFVESEVTGILNGVVVLPCSWTFGEIEVIHWKLGNKKVHIYFEKKDQKQDPSYKGRTSLFVDQIKNGNASLQLKNLQKSDEGTYTCYVSSTKSDTITVPLKVEAVVWGEQNKTVIIPCSFNPGEDVVIHWKINESRNVHSYYQGQDMLEKQDESYKGRTSLILSELAKGNASLQLRDLQKGDENTYHCYVGTTRVRPKEDYVKLEVADFGHSMEYDNQHLKCFARNVYPSDIVTIEWYENNNLKNDTRGSSACPSCELMKNSYKCVIKHSMVQSTWTGTWKIKAPQSNSVECACSTCKTTDKEMPVRLYLRKNGNVSEIPHNRTQELEKGLRLPNLTAEDNGDYLCEIRTTDGMFITVTSINITEKNEKQQRNRWSVIAPIAFCVVCCLLYCCIVSLCKRQKNKSHCLRCIPDLNHPPD